MESHPSDTLLLIQRWLCLNARAGQVWQFHTEAYRKFAAYIPHACGGSGSGSTRLISMETVTVSTR